MKTVYPFLLLTVFLPCCAPMSNENAKPSGAALGAAGGAVLGGIIGHQSGRAGEGAAIGAAAGGMSGWENGPKWLGGDGSISRTRVGN